MENLAMLVFVQHQEKMVLVAEMGRQSYARLLLEQRQSQWQPLAAPLVAEPA
jgi:hypothetical protein